ncbi:hypothetical protein [Streptomyces sp. NPDC005890]|uniref:hypothetical protein n=1 Tax=Streptomyces sp. NPDC005890 TaxID=3154568 RepID=UPI0033E254E0
MGRQNVAEQFVGILVRAGVRRLYGVVQGRLPARGAGAGGRRHRPPTGFALSASNIVLDGGVGRMLRMGRSNLRNVPRP